MRGRGGASPGRFQGRLRADSAEGRAVHLGSCVLTGVRQEGSKLGELQTPAVPGSAPPRRRPRPAGTVPSAVELGARERRLGPCSLLLADDLFSPLTGARALRASKPCGSPRSSPRPVVRCRYTPCPCGTSAPRGGPCDFFSTFSMPGKTGRAWTFLGDC